MYAATVMGSISQHWRNRLADTSRESAGRLILAAGGTEEIAIDVIGDAGHFDIIVQTLIETMMAGNVVLLAPFSCKRTQRRRPCTK